MTEYRKDNTGCAHAYLVAAENGRDDRRMCALTGKCEWMSATWCDMCRDRRLER